MNFKHLLAGSLLAVSVAAGCRDASTGADAPSLDPNTVIARWKGGEIRRGAIQRALDGRFAAVPKPISAETKRAIVKLVVERRVRTAMLYEEAEAKGFDKRPEVIARQTAFEEATLADDLLASETASAKATDEQVVAEVDRRLAGSKPEETRKFSHIYLRAAESDPAARAAATARMAEIRKEIEGGAGFNKLAEKYSTSVTARGGGRIEWTTHRALNRLAADAIFALKEGEMSPVIAAPDGLHLFRLEGIRPGTPVDVEALRKNVRETLDQEARSAAVRARRQQELDARGVVFASEGELERLAAAAETAGAQAVASWKGGEVTAAELFATEGWGTLAQGNLRQALRTLAENRLLAEARRAKPRSDQVTTRVAEARRQALIDSYRRRLVEDLSTEPTEEEIARFHRENSESALFLRDFEVDALFFPQAGDSVKEVYAAGEAVVEKLREGKPFDELLGRPAGADARVCRAVHGVDVARVGQASVRLRKALLNLSPGEVTPALYLDGPRTELAPKSCVLEGKGVVFVRLRSLGALPLDASRESIRASLKQEKEAAGIEAIQKRLIASSGLQILVPEG